MAVMDVNVESPNSPRPKTPRGRPRDPAIESRAIEATREILVEAGYNGLSMDLVAKRASVGRPTLYLRWPSKAHLVFASLFPGTIDDRRWIEDTGDLSVDLRTFLAAAAAYFSTPVFRAGWPGLLADFSGDPDLRREVIAAQWQTMRGTFVTRLQRSDVCPSISPMSAIDLLDVLIGALYQRAAVLQEPLGGFIDVLVDLAIVWIERSDGPETPATTSADS